MKIFITRWREVIPLIWLSYHGGAHSTNWRKTWSDQPLEKLVVYVNPYKFKQQHYQCKL